ncbi:MAG: ParA family protein [Pseudomonadota bacterium]|nr:ParA family protein [Pseudomonadota bacterium]MEC8461160.1 ParA family protein [Pseudomonadota bacterium]
MVTISISNQKGGVGKTTTAVSLSAALSLMGYSVLLIDCDPQSNATVSAGVPLNSVIGSIANVLMGSKKVRDCVLTTEHGFDVLPSTHQLTGAEVALMSEHKREWRLANALREEQSRYDYILIDCPPSLNILTLNALVASNSVLVPLQCEYLALEGVSKLLKTIGVLNQSLGVNVAICGVVRTMYDGRNLLSRQVSHQLNKNFKAKLFSSIIPRNVRLAEAPSHGVPITGYDRRSQGAASYFALAAELAQRSQVTEGVLEDVLNG